MERKSSGSGWACGHYYNIKFYSPSSVQFSLPSALPKSVSVTSDRKEWEAVFRGRLGVQRRAMATCDFLDDWGNGL